VIKITATSLDLNPVDYHLYGTQCWYMPKPTNIAELRTALSKIWDDLPLEFIDKDIVSFHDRLRSCVAVVGGYFEHCSNTEPWAVHNRHWNVRTADEKLCKVSFVIREHSMHNCAFTSKSELKSL